MHPNHFDFFLVSAAAKQGSAQPTHYKVLYSEIEVDPDQIYQLTYRLCYLYFHTNAGIKIPAPVQYASRLSKLIVEKANKDTKGPLVVPGERYLNNPTLFFI